MKFSSLAATAAAFLSVAYAQPLMNIAGPQYVSCACTATTRGYRVDAVDKLYDGVNVLDKLRSDLVDAGKPAAEVNAELNMKSGELWLDCVASYSYEECSNADTALRNQTCFPGCASFCQYDRTTWVNVDSKGNDVPSCETDSNWRSAEEDIVNGLFPENVRATAVVPISETVSAAASPTVTPVPSESSASSTSPMAQPSASSTSTAVTTADATPLAAIPPGVFLPSASPSASILMPPSLLSNDVVDTMIPVESPMFTEEPVAPTAVSSPFPTVVNEGCVAVEHLRGYVMQHSRHLRRPVLCSRGFCATPNHAIIIDGRWTSMKRLCNGEWECVGAVKLVNNLKVAANTRAVLENDIIVTPYDVRFPIWAVWAVQMMEDVVQLVLPSMMTGAMAVIAIIVFSRVQKGTST